MGSYVNPGGWPTDDPRAGQRMSKEDWLAEHGTRLLKAPAWSDVPPGQLPVCLVDNGWMTAAGIAYFPDELQSFKDDLAEKYRPNCWFLVPTAQLVKVSNVQSEAHYWRRVPEAQKEGVAGNA